MAAQVVQLVVLIAPDDGVTPHRRSTGFTLRGKIVCFKCFITEPMVLVVCNDILCPSQYGVDVVLVVLVIDVLLTICTVGCRRPTGCRRRAPFAGDGKSGVPTAAAVTTAGPTATVKRVVTVWRCFDYEIVVLKQRKVHRYQS